MSPIHPENLMIIVIAIIAAVVLPGIIYELFYATKEEIERMYF